MNMTAKESYDNHADQWSARLVSGANPAHSLLEKPAMNAMLPDLHGKRVLAIGCGSGEEVAMLLGQGMVQKNLVGIDVSMKLIETARASFPDAWFDVLPMEELGVFPDAAFDFVYSSLTMHYAADWAPILAQVKRILRPGGRMLFSTHHPVKWGAQVLRGPSMDQFAMGYDRPKSGMPTVYGDYLGTRKVNDTWFGNMDVSYHHRPLEALLGDILASGLTLRRFREPAPVPEAKDINPAFWEIHSKIPLFMIFELE